MLRGIARIRKVSATPQELIVEEYACRSGGKKNWDQEIFCLNKKIILLLPEKNICIKG